MAIHQNSNDKSTPGAYKVPECGFLTGVNIPDICLLPWNKFKFN